MFPSADEATETQFVIGATVAVKFFADTVVRVEMQLRMTTARNEIRVFFITFRTQSQMLDHGLRDDLNSVEAIA